jgi:oxysterol-binding protein-related protein 8
VYCVTIRHRLIFFFLCKLTYYEFFFSNIDLDVDSQVDGGNAVMSCAESESDSDVADVIDSEEECLETPYVLAREDEFGAVSKKAKKKKSGLKLAYFCLCSRFQKFPNQAGEQVEELGEENKSLIWFLVKQVRPGMDLSKVVLPTFILEPRSFLDKLSDSYYHADILSK